MNDLSRYNAWWPQAGPGIVFWRGTGLISDAISEFSGSAPNDIPFVPTHAAWLLTRRAALPLDSPNLTGVFVLESTELAGTGKSGPQINDLGVRIANYDASGRIMVFPLSRAICEALNWEAIDALIRSKVGDRYNTLELITDALDRLPLLDKLHLAHPEPHAEVCCELCLELLWAGGAAKFLGSRMPPAYGSTPLDLMKLSEIYACGSDGGLLTVPLLG